MSSALLPIGYYEAPLACSTGERTMAVWLPINRNAAPAPLGTYHMKIMMGKKLQILASMVVPGGVPSWLVCCLPTVQATMPTATPGLCAATPDIVAPPAEVRGLVVIAHGLSDGPLTFAHVAETLASRGFIVATPACADSTAVDDAHSVLQHGKAYLLEHSIIRAHVMETCIDSLRSTFAEQLAGKQTALVGYSIGTDTVRAMRAACPRVYVAGPGWEQKIAGSVRPIHPSPTPGGPSLQLLCEPDGQMDMFDFSSDEVSGVMAVTARSRCLHRRWRVVVTQPQQQLR